MYFPPFCQAPSFQSHRARARDLQCPVGLQKERPLVLPFASEPPQKMKNKDPSIEAPILPYKEEHV